jgi:Transcription elongation factor, GreA/GreB, C-term
LDRADVILPVDVPFDVVTMNSEVAVRDMESNEEMMFAVVFPSAADVNRQRISILAPLKKNAPACIGVRCPRAMIGLRMSGERPLNKGTVASWWRSSGAA